MSKIKKMKFVPALRKGNTGIGYTLETMLGIRENNYPEGDFVDTNEYKGTLFELKSQRYEKNDPRKDKPHSKSSHLISLITQAPHGGMTNREMILEFGYSDEKNRKRRNLYATINSTKFVKSKHKFVGKMKIKREGDRLHLLVDNRKIAYVNLDKILGKLDNLLIVRAKSEFKKCTCKENTLHVDGYHEYFYFDMPCIYTNFCKKKFYELIDNGKIYYDLRMHIPEGELDGNEGYDTKHDHGTGFRIKFENIKGFYNKERLL